VTILPEQTRSSSTDALQVGAILAPPFRAAELLARHRVERASKAAELVIDSDAARVSGVFRLYCRC
jgi:hypothetical protein